MQRGRIAIALGSLVFLFGWTACGAFGGRPLGLAGEPARRGETPAGAAAQAASEKPAGFPVRPATPKPIKKIYLMTDLEGVAGVRDAQDWCGPEGRYYDVGRRFLTLEVNAAIEGFIRGGAEEIVVADGHGRGAVDIELLDPRAQLERGWPTGFPGPSLPTGGFDAIAWVGQHAKAGTPNAHLAHTQGFNYLDLSVNGVSIGEFGQLALCASQLGVRAILATGDKALAEEAQALVPGIETVQVKRGTTPGRGDELTYQEYGVRNTAAIHLQPVAARAAIREGAERAIRRAQREHFGLLTVKPPFERVARFRPARSGEPVLVSRESHAQSVIDLMNLPFKSAPEK
ncbi:MAG: M55 family metallopeptidase [Pirellulales bacterium]